MRFRHVDPAPVIAYLRGTSPGILILDWERERKAGGIAGLLNLQKPQPAGPARPASIEDVEFIARRGPPSHAGLVLRYYFHVNATATARPLTLVEAVEHVEAQGAADEYVIAGHPDGGLISVSRDRMSFQSGDPITWWGP
jgi:hypothetical protein